MVVIGELKLAFNLELVLQGVDRASAGDEIWLAAKLSANGRGRERDPAVPQPLPPSRLRHARRRREGRGRGDRQPRRAHAPQGPRTAVRGSSRSTGAAPAIRKRAAGRESP